jgi:hypothetical protein
LTISKISQKSASILGISPEELANELKKSASTEAYTIPPLPIPIPPPIPKLSLSPSVEITTPLEVEEISCRVVNSMFSFLLYF